MSATNTKVPDHEYRAIVHRTEDGKPRTIRPRNSAEDTAEHMANIIDHHRESGYATGGHVEVWVRGIGWVVDE